MPIEQLPQPLLQLLHIQAGSSGKCAAEWPNLGQSRPQCMYVCTAHFQFDSQVCTG